MRLRDLIGCRFYMDSCRAVGTMFPSVVNTIVFITLVTWWLLTFFANFVMVSILINGTMCFSVSSCDSCFRSTGIDRHTKVAMMLLTWNVMSIMLIVRVKKRILLYCLCYNPSLQLFRASRVRLDQRKHLLFDSPAIPTLYSSPVEPLNRVLDNDNDVMMKTHEWT